MGKRVWGLMMALLLLTGCGGRTEGDGEQMALDVRAKYLAMTGCTAQLDITADYGERVFSCKVDLDHTAGQETVLTIQEPELLRGVTARIREEESLLEFQGICLETGPLSPEGLSPVDCIPYFFREIREGFLSQWGMEEVDGVPCLRLTTSDPERKAGEGTETVLWFRQEDFALCRGEIRVDGWTGLRCEVTGFQWKEGA